MTPLSNLHVLVTRPDPQGSQLCEQIRQAGGMATHFATIEFAPPEDMAGFQQAIAKLGEQDWLIFISREAVISTVPTLRARWPVLPSTVQFAAIGAATAEALTQAGYNSAVFSKQDWSTEGLMALPEFAALNGKKVAIIRGEGGRELLAETLLDKGATVTHVVAYRRLQPKTNADPIVALIKDHQIDMIVCSSFAAVDHLKKMLGNAIWPDLQKTPLLVMSERIKNLASDLGFQTIWVARDTMLFLTERQRQERRDMREDILDRDEIPETPSKNKTWISVAILLMALTALIVGAVLFIQTEFNKAASQFSREVTSVQMQSHETNQRIATLGQTVTDLQKNLEKTQQAAQQQAAELARDNASAELYARLSQVSGQIDQLPLPALQGTKVEPIQPIEDSSKNSWWRNGLKHGIDALNKIVTVKYIGDDLPPVITPEAKAYLYQNLHAQLENAMWAALHHQPEVYQISITRMSAWIKRYFRSDAPETMTLLQQLDELAKAM